MRINLYNQGFNTVVIDGVPMTGFGEGDFMELKLDGNAAVRTQGGSGPVMNISVPQGGQMLLTLLPTSASIHHLISLREAQKRAARMFTFALITGVQEFITASGCAFGELPAFTNGGPVQTGRQFNIQFLEMKLDESALEAVAGGLVGGLIG